MLMENGTIPVFEWECWGDKITLQWLDTNFGFTFYTSNIIFEFHRMTFRGLGREVKNRKRTRCASRARYPFSI